jgi:hypothetical protein
VIFSTILPDPGVEEISATPVKPERASCVYLIQRPAITPVSSKRSNAMFKLIFDLIGGLFGLVFGIIGGVFGLIVIALGLVLLVLAIVLGILALPIILLAIFF